MKWNWDPAFWREPSYLFHHRAFGFSIWISGAEIQLGKLMFRMRWISR